MISKKCVVCSQSNGTYKMANNGGYYHKKCARCQGCDVFVYGNPWCILYRGKLYCDTPCIGFEDESVAIQCVVCQKLFGGNDMVREINKRFYHGDCLACSVCKTSFKTGEQFKIDEEGRSFLCETHMNPEAVNKKPKFARTRINATQRQILNHYYVRAKYPNDAMKNRISAETDLDLRVIKIWFQNRRARC